MKNIFLLFIAFSILLALPVAGQERDDDFLEGKMFSHLGVALGLSSMGVGVEVATPLNSRFKLRAGLDYMGYNTSTYDVELSDNSNKDLYKAFGYIPDYRMGAKLKCMNGHALVDFHPVKKGIFHITAGVYIGNNKIKAGGFLADGSGNPAQLLEGYKWPVIQFDDYQINTEGGNVDLQLKLGQVVKPYIGLGLGRAISKSRVSFKFELGAIYQGKYSLTQNVIEATAPAKSSEVEIVDVDKYTKWLEWWPMVNFQLSYRIF